MVYVDNGKIRIRQHKSAFVVEAYTSYDISAADVELVISTLTEHSKPPHLLIALKQGDYWLSSDAQRRILSASDDFLKIAFVVSDLDSVEHANRAKDTYLYTKNVFIESSLDEAYEALIGTVTESN